VLLFGITGVRTSSFAQSPWRWQNPLPQGNELSSVVAVRADTFIAVGGAATAMSTTDGGMTWAVQPYAVTPYPGVGMNLVTGVSFVDANTGWAVGEGIFHTIDGGATWTLQYSPYPPEGPMPYPFGVKFVDAKTGWVVGNNGMILHTDDGGATWRYQHR